MMQIEEEPSSFDDSDENEEKIAPWDMLQTAMEIKTFTEQIWTTYDVDGSGYIDFDEAYQLVSDTIAELDINLNLSKQDYIEFFEMIDVNGDKTFS